jgi:hypothetical protein
MLSLDDDQRRMLSEKLPDAANGSGAWLALMSWAIMLARRRSL